MSSEKTSITAYYVVFSLAKLERLARWKHYFSEEMRTLNNELIRYTTNTAYRRLISYLPSPLFIYLMEKLFVPGMVYHFLFRKRLIEKQLVSALSDGVQQVIVLGGGLDSLALRMSAQHPNVTFFEIDLPKTQHIKTSLLQSINYPLASNLAFVPVDLAHATLKQALGNHDGFDAGRSTFVIIEGVLMYLSESEVKQLFTHMHDLFTGDLTVVFGAIAQSDDEGNWQIKMVNRLLYKNKESTKWFCPHHDMKKFANDLGYNLIESITYKSLQRSYRETSEISNIPEEDENYYIVTKMTHSLI